MIKPVDYLGIIIKPNKLSKEEEYIIKKAMKELRELCKINIYIKENNMKKQIEEFLKKEKEYIKAVNSFNTFVDSLYNESISKVDVFMNFYNGDRFFEENQEIVFNPSNKGKEKEEVIEEYHHKFIEELITYDMLITRIHDFMKRREMATSMGSSFPNMEEKGLDINNINSYIRKRDEIMKQFYNFIKFFNLDSYKYIGEYERINKEEQTYFCFTSYEFNMKDYLEKKNKDPMEYYNNKKETKEETNVKWEEDNFSYYAKSYNRRKNINRLLEKYRDKFGITCLVDDKGRIYECPYGCHNLLIEIFAKKKWIKIKNMDFPKDELISKGWIVISQGELFFDRINKKQVDNLYDYIELTKEEYKNYNIKYLYENYNDIFEIYDKYRGEI